MYEKLPDILEDKFWESVDVVLPYTEESEPFHKKPFHGSVVDIMYTSLCQLGTFLFFFAVNLHILLHLVIVIISANCFSGFTPRVDLRNCFCEAYKIYCLFRFTVVQLFVSFSDV